MNPALLLLWCESEVLNWVVHDFLSSLYLQTSSGPCEDKSYDAHLSRSEPLHLQTTEKKA